MANRKTDIVRRSLFGAGDADQFEATRDAGQIRPSRKSRGSKNPVAASPRQAVDQRQPGTTETRRQVERTAVTVPSELLMRVKDAVAVLNGWPHQYTMARFVEEAFTAQLERLKREHNGGREFPITNRKIRTGRPPGT